MNLDRLRTFRVLAESLHFRRTAERLHLSQSAVSQQITTLEHELGVMLVERIGRRTFLTPAGRVLADEAGKILAAVDRAAESVRAFGGGEIDRLRLGASTTPGIYIVPAALGAFRTALPLVELSFRIANSEEIEHALVANELDLGIVGEEIAHAELFQVAIGEDEIVAIAAPTLVTRRRLRAAELERLPLLAREAGSATRRHVDHGLAKLGAKPKVAFELPSPEAQVRAAVAGLGIAFVSRHVAAADLAARRLVVLRIEGMRLVRPITAAYHRDKRLSPAIQQLITLARRAAHPARSS
ncbi:MAG TPA: LysR substrate-binding domain-containing protein [Kofleriaceae bacterium]|nr:LysR substrate-binding domain-containing protein [Kofleriaceae bacterium]